MPAALGVPETQTLPRFYLVPVNSPRPWTTLSRVQSAGCDHTGRTNPIAHHFAVDSNNLRSFGGSVASLVRWASRHYFTDSERVFCDRWDDEPKELAPRQLEKTRLASPLFLLETIPPASGADQADIQRALFAAVEALLAYPTSQRMVVFVIRPSFAPHILSFLAAVLSGLPKAIQFGVTAISHVWELSDAPAGYSLAFTYPRSPYLERIKERADSKKPVIVDLALKVPAIPAITSEYAAILKSDCEHWGDADYFPVPSLCDDIDPALTRPETVYAVKKLVDNWTQNPSYFSFDALVQGIGEASQAKPPQAGFSLLLTRTGLASLDRFIAASDWNTVYETAVSEHFPASVRDPAWAAIRTNFTRIVESEPELIAQRTLQPSGERIIALIAEHEEAIDVLLQEVNVQANCLSSQGCHAVAARWSGLGTKVLGRTWNRMASDIAKEAKPSAFYRRLLDKLIPNAIVPDQAPSDPENAPVPQVALGLESLLRPAWTIISRQLRVAAKPDPLSLMIVERLAGRAIVPQNDRRLPDSQAADIPDLKSAVAVRSQL